MQSIIVVSPQGLSYSTPGPKSPAPEPSSPKAPQPEAQIQETQAQPQSRCARAFGEQTAHHGKTPTLADGLAPRSSTGGVRAAKPVAVIAPRTAPQTTEAAEGAGAAEAAEAAEASRATSTVSNLKTNDKGTLSFTLYIPSKKAGEPGQKYKISVLGGATAELEGLDLAELAEHLGQTIDLVQNDPKTANFSSITFEGQQSDKNLAKAVVKLDSGSLILGGNPNDVVAGTQKIFSTELDTLLQRLHKILTKSEVARTRIERADDDADDLQPTAPPPTPATPATPLAQNDRGPRGHKSPLKFTVARQNDDDT